MGNKKKPVFVFLLIVLREMECLFMGEKTDWIMAVLPLLEDGQTLEITPIGSSMFPLFDKERDQAVLAAANTDRLRRGDVVLYRRDSGMLILHRIWKRKKDGFYMVGDNQTEIEGPLRAEQIKAVMVSFCRKGRRISCRNPVYLVLSHIWLFLRPVRHIISRPIGKMYRLVERRKESS